MEEEKILIVDDDESTRYMLSITLKKEGYAVDMVNNGKQGLDMIAHDQYKIVLCDMRMPVIDGTTFLQKARKIDPKLPVIIITAFGNSTLAGEMIKEGAIDFILKPFKTDEIILAIKKAEERIKLLSEIHVYQDKEAEPAEAITSIVTKSHKMNQILATIKKIGDYKTTVLIMGESGTGKELIARAIHDCSSRNRQRFVTVNCGAIPENLLESELFGHVKGSFTGAHKSKKGLFEEANNGTLFLDEVGELPLLLQVKLLRALQEEEIRRVGDTQPLHVNVRIIAATVRDLTAEVENGNFREDLFYRLNVLPIYLPALRERKEDIPILADHFIKKYNDRLKLNLEGIGNEAMKVLLNYDWAGNVRELENTIERAMVLTNGNIIEKDALPVIINNYTTAPKLELFGEDNEELSIKILSRKLEEHLIKKALKKTNGNRTKAAKLLEISHRALIYKIQEFGFDNNSSLE